MPAQALGGWIGFLAAHCGDDHGTQHHPSNEVPGVVVVPTCQLPWRISLLSRWISRMPSRYSRCAPQFLASAGNEATTVVAIRNFTMPSDSRWFFMVYLGYCLLPDFMAALNFSL